MKLTNQLSLKPPGRIVLHAACILRHPGHWNWHWQGICRELAPRQEAGMPSPHLTAWQGLAVLSAALLVRAALW